MHITFATTITFVALALAAPKKHAENTKASSPPNVVSSKSDNCSSIPDWMPQNNIYLNGNDCAPFKPISNNVCLAFGRWDTVAKSITLYTDDNCKNVGKPGAVKNPSHDTNDFAVACVHPSDFGGEAWGSVAAQM
ncbi:hypothetical protein ACLMJK_000915 [Lecanora helva]